MIPTINIPMGIAYPLYVCESMYDCMTRLIPRSKYYNKNNILLKIIFKILINTIQFVKI